MSETRKIFKNISWLFLDKIIRMAVGLFVGVWVARHLGPDQFGTLNYTFALVFILGTFANLGIDALVVMDLVKNPERKNELLGTSLILKLLAGFISSIFAIVLIILLRSDDYISQYLVFILIGFLIFQAFDTIDLFYQSKVKSKFTVYAKSAGFLLANLLKVYFIVSEKTILYFALTLSLEIIFGAIFLIFSLKWHQLSIFQWKFNWSLAKDYLRRGYLLLLSGFAMLALLKIDQIMLGELANDQEVGIYSAAVRLSEIWYQIPLIISVSVFPSILNAQYVDKHIYLKRIQKSIQLIVWLTIAAAIFVWFFADFIIEIIFGVEFLEAGTILAVHFWAGIFMAQNVITNKFYIAENRNAVIFYKNGFGLLCNILLNIFLIPQFQALGAAIATLISYAFLGFLGDWFFDKRIFFLQIKAVFRF